MKKFIFTLLIFFDIAIFIYLFVFEEYIILIILLHLLTYSLAWKINKGFDKEKIEIPFYIILFMPIVGPFIYFVFYFSYNYFFSDNELIMDYEKMIDSKLQKASTQRLEYEKEIKTMSFIDMLSYMDPDRKKEVLIDSQYSVKINNANILKKGLESDDKEVQHYSATLLNSKENELTNNISYLREKYNLTKNEKFLDQLIYSYQMYLNSTLIEEDSIDIFRQEYIEVLNIKVKNKTHNLSTLEDMFKTYIQLDNLEQAEIINNKIELEYGISENVLLNKLNLLYKKGNLNEVNKILSQMDQKTIESNDKLMDLREFFIKEK